jgi:putative transposase
MNMIIRDDNSQHIPNYYIGQNDRVTVVGKPYRWVESDVHCHVLAHEADEDRREVFSHAKFYSLMLLDQVDVNRGFYGVEAGKTISVFDQARLGDLPEKKLRRALFYGDICNEFLRQKVMAIADRSLPSVSLSDASLERVLPLIERRVRNGKKRGGTETIHVDMPSDRQFRRIFKRYVENGYDPMSLVNRSAGPKSRTSIHDTKDVAIWVDFAKKFADRKKPTMAAVYRDTNAAIDVLNEERAAQNLILRKKPSRKVFEKLIKSLNLFWVTAKREGPDAAKKKFQITFNGVTAERPGERVEIDEWRVDLCSWLTWCGIWDQLDEKEKKAVKRTRLWMTAAVDVATRCILAMVFHTKDPCHQTAVDALEMIVTDKSRISAIAGTGSPWLAHLTPESITTDNGSAFSSTMTRGVIADLSCAQFFPPAKTPQLRGTIESLFKTFSAQFLHWFEGRTFSNYIQRGDYDSEKNACLSVDELNIHLVRAAVDIYHHNQHSGLGGETPHNAWLRLSKKYGIIPPPPSDIKRHIFGVKIEGCKISDKGVRFLGIHYQSRELQALRYSTKATVDIRVDRFNLKTISVWTGNSWLSVDSKAGLPQDVSVWEWVGAARELEHIHGKNAEAKLSVVAHAINRQRLSGEAATARASLVASSMDEAKLLGLQDQLFKKFDLIDDIVDGDAVLAPLFAAADPLHHGIPGITDTLYSRSTNIAEEDYADGAPSPFDDESIVIKGTDDISFDQ